MTRLALVLLLGCAGPGGDGPGRNHDSDVETDTDTDIATVCPPAAWTWGAENLMTTAEASFIGATPQSYAYTADTPGDLDGDGGNDLYITALFENDSAGGLYFILGGVERVLGQPLAGRPSLIATPGDPLGRDVRPIGDINNDGMQDIMQLPANGAGHLIFGHTGPWLVNASWADVDATINNTGFAFGMIAAPGDYDGDGGDDLLLSAAGDKGGGLHGLVGTDVVGDLHLPDDSTTWLTGAAASGAGDFDGDGRTDLILNVDTGGCRVVMAVDFTGLHNVPASDLASVGQLSGAVSCLAIPDLDGDGDDEIIAASAEAFYLFTDVSGWTSSISLESANATFAVGDSTLVDLVALADLNGDGLGEFGITRSLPQSARAYEDYVFFGRAVWPSALTVDHADIAIESGATNWYRRHFGGSHLQGDINGDGYGDLVLYENDEPVNGVSMAGRVYVYLGGPTWTRALTLDDADVVFGGDRASQRMGEHASLEDVDGDGCDDLITGSNGHQPDNAGEVFVLFGQHSGG